MVAAVFVDVVDEDLGHGGRLAVLGDEIVLDGEPLELVHQVRDLDAGRAAHRAVVARGAEPDGVALDHAVDHPGAERGDDLARAPVHEVARRAGPGAGAALLADADLLPPGHAEYVLIELLMKG